MVFMKTADVHMCIKFPTTYNKSTSLLIGRILKLLTAISGNILF